MPPITVPKLRQVFPVRKSSSHWLDSYASCRQSPCKQHPCFRATGNSPLTQAGIIQSGGALNIFNSPDSLDSLNQALDSPDIDSSDIDSPDIDSLDVHCLIRAAQQKLRDPHTSDQLKLTAYVKFCCLAIQKSFIAEQMVPPADLYDHYLQKLGCETAWWNQCHITNGKVTSENPNIQDLLTLLDNVVQVFEEG